MFASGVCADCPLPFGREEKRIVTTISKPASSEFLLLKRGFEPIPGYQLVEQLGKGGFGEVWKCITSGDLVKAIKIVHGSLNDLHSIAAEQELEALQHVKALRHPFLLSMERVEIVAGRLIIVTELADCSLRNVAADCRAKGLPGIPRETLLNYLREAAEVLDWMNTSHGLQHLDIKPANLLLMSNHVKVADFGQVRSLTGPGLLQPGTGPPLGTPHFASPEAFQRTVTPYADQYSLAIVYMQLLTGLLPFSSKSLRQLASQHLHESPVLEPLPRRDRAVVGRALAKEPEDRFPSCLEFIASLQGGPKPAVTSVAAGAPRSQEEAAAQPAAQGDWHCLECVGYDALGELWKVQTAKGRPRLARFTHGLPAASGRDEADILDLLCQPGHAGLAGWEVARRESARLVLMTDADEITLQQRLQECRKNGSLGLPRDELLGYLRQAAVALDHWAEVSGLLHLGLRPRAFWLTDGKLRLIDNGLVQLLDLAAHHNLFEMNRSYSAPELFHNRITSTCDQYSLALIYQEALTGSLPHRSTSLKGLAEARWKSCGNLTHLPVSDRAAVGRALDPNPQRRFSSCRDFVTALEGASAESQRKQGTLLAALPPVIAVPDGYSLSAPSSLPSLNQYLSQFVAAAAGRFQEHDREDLRYLLKPGEDLWFRGGARVIPEMLLLRLANFCQAWNARVVAQEANRIELQVPLVRGWWQSFTGKKGGLHVGIHFYQTAVIGARFNEVAMQIRPFGCSQKAAELLLRGPGFALLSSLREHLQLNREQRLRERYCFNLPLRVYSVRDDRRLGDVMDCQAKDVSLGGMGLVAAVLPPSEKVYIHPPSLTCMPEAAVFGEIVRIDPRTDGSFELGVAFKIEHSNRQKERNNQ
jgi:serine/threonine protein kinase